MVSKLKTDIEKAEWSLESRFQGQFKKLFNLTKKMEVIYGKGYREEMEKF